MAAFAVVLTTVATAAAHEERPAIVDVKIFPSGQMKLAAELDFESLLSTLPPGRSEQEEDSLYERYQALSGPDLELEVERINTFLRSAIVIVADGEVKDLTLTGKDVPLKLDRGERLSVQYLESKLERGTSKVLFLIDPLFRDTIIRVSSGLTSQSMGTSFILKGDSSEPLQISESFWSHSAEIYYRFIFPLISSMAKIEYYLVIILITIFRSKVDIFFSQIIFLILGHLLGSTIFIFGDFYLSLLQAHSLFLVCLLIVGLHNIYVKNLARFRIIIFFWTGVFQQNYFINIQEINVFVENELFLEVIIYLFMSMVTQLIIVLAFCKIPRALNSRVDKLNSNIRFFGSVFVVLFALGSLGYISML